MRVAYISPSSVPSRAANAAHVILQCDGLARAGAGVTLYAQRTVADARDLASAIRDAYGVETGALRICSYFSQSPTAVTFRIATMALADLARQKPPDAVVSRNLYASFALAVLRRRPLLFETHQLEVGIRKTLQRAIMARPWVTTVVISDRLVECLEEHHGTRPRRVLVLHDAAPDGIEVVPTNERRASLASLVPAAAASWDAVCGYFGHLYPGRGIEIIEAMANARPRCLFLVYGGNDSDVEGYRARNRLNNLQYAGHVPHIVARRLMTSFDVLLMPYQEKVSIGTRSHDTARWMSPMKMFEYLAAGVPIISSDLPALCEVLRGGENCLLVPPAAPDSWISALDRLIADPVLAASIGATAHAEYRAGRSWTRRAERLLAAARSL